MLVAVVFAMMVTAASVRGKRRQNSSHGRTRLKYTRHGPTHSPAPCAPRTVTTDDRVRAVDVDVVQVDVRRAVDDAGNEVLLPEPASSEVVRDRRLRKACTPVRRSNQRVAAPHQL